MEPNQNNKHETSTHIEPHILRRYNIIRKVGSGAYGHVWKVQDKLTKKIYALKKIFDAFQHSTDAQRTYREIQILRQTHHPNIIKLIETSRADNNKDVYLVFQFMEADLHNVIAEGILKDVHIKFIVYQIAKALKYLHTGKIIHRDLKPSNILINSNCSIKLCDFGLVRSLSSGDQSSVPTLTQGVATRWYRAPEVLLGSKSYSTPADIWSFGCIIYQILAQKPLFPGNSTSDQIDKILMFTGYPNEEDIKSLQSQVASSMLQSSKIAYNSQKVNFLKDFDPGFCDLLSKIIVFNPRKRIGVQEILAHEIVKPFRKKDEEVQCDQEIRTSIDDNKKLSVEEYRSFIYGNRRSNTPTSTNVPKAETPVKKSNSYGKLSSGAYSYKTSLAEKVNRDKQTLKYVRSAKEIQRPMHSYNKSAEIMHPENVVQSHQEAHNSSHGPPNRQIKTRIGEKNESKPIYLQKGRSFQQSSHMIGSPPPNNTFYMNSPKMTGQVQNRPLFKTSKYILTKTEPAQKNYPA